MITEDAMTTWGYCFGAAHDALPIFSNLCYNTERGNQILGKQGEFQYV